MRALSFACMIYLQVLCVVSGLGSLCYKKYTLVEICTTAKVEKKRVLSRADYSFRTFTFRVMDELLVNLKFAHFEILFLMFVNHNILILFANSLCIKCVMWVKNKSKVKKKKQKLREWLPIGCLKYLLEGEALLLAY